LCAENESLTPVERFVCTIVWRPNEIRLMRSSDGSTIRSSLGSTWKGLPPWQWRKGRPEERTREGTHVGWRRGEGDSSRGDFGEARARDTRPSPLAPLSPLEIAPGTLIPFNQTPVEPVTVVSLCLLFVARGRKEGHGASIV